MTLELHYKIEDYYSLITKMEATSSGYKEHVVVRLDLLRQPAEFNKRD